MTTAISSEDAFAFWWDLYCQGKRPFTEAEKLIAEHAYVNGWHQRADYFAGKPRMMSIERIPD